MEKEALYQLIHSRRSIRAYKSTPIDPSLLERVLDAGLWSASGKNLQNWRFFVLTEKKRDAYLALSQKSWLTLKDNLKRKLKPSLYEFTERFFFTLGNAPVLILAYAVIDEQDHPQTQMGNVYLAVQNMVLAAQAEGLGSCILGSPLEIEADVRNFLGLQDRPNWKLVCGLTVGHAAHSPPAPPRQITDRVHFLKD